MHVSPSAFRTVRRNGILVSFAVLGDLAYAVADIPTAGSSSTFLEEWCERPHWAFTLTGSVDVEFEDGTTTLPAGSAVHIPAGVRHRLVVEGRARLAGFELVTPDAPQSDDDLRRVGFEIVGSHEVDAPAVAVVRPKPERPAAAGEIVADSRRMGEYLFTRARLGTRAGYTSDECDVPHWGLVTSGGLVIEWEDDVEVLRAGDVFYCPAGPPGHRLQAADPAVVLDLTPIDSLAATERIAEWRRRPTTEALAAPTAPAGLQVAALV
jgi:quercetin dioxygenase-like cupin family protein